MASSPVLEAAKIGSGVGLAPEQGHGYEQGVLVGTTKKSEELAVGVDN